MSQAKHLKKPNKLHLYSLSNSKNDVVPSVPVTTRAVPNIDEAKDGDKNDANLNKLKEQGQGSMDNDRKRNSGNLLNKFSFEIMCYREYISSRKLSTKKQPCIRQEFSQEYW